MSLFKISLLSFFLVAWTNNIDAQAHLKKEAHNYDQAFSSIVEDGEMDFMAALVPLLSGSLEKEMMVMQLFNEWMGYNKQGEFPIETKMVKIEIDKSNNRATTYHTHVWKVGKSDMKYVTKNVWEETGSDWLMIEAPGQLVQKGKVKKAKKSKKRR